MTDEDYVARNNFIQYEERYEQLYVDTNYDYIVNLRM